MTNLFTTKTNFASGELSHDLLGRVDLTSYENGALELKNVFIQPTGGIHRRAGTKYIGTLTETGRLIAYEKSTTETYVIILQDKKTLIYQNDTLMSTLETPWTMAQVYFVRWCQGTEELYLTHPDIAPQKLFIKDGEWHLEPFTFLTDKECILQPYHKFCDDDVTIESSGLGGNVTLTASKPVFKEKHVNKLFKIGNGYALITAITSETKANATVKKQLIEDGADETKLEPTRSWGEPAFDDEYGWPCCVAFYQSRLVFGGSRKLPNRLWFSQSGELTNFELGNAYDSEGIDFNILSDQSNSICALFAGRHLQVFTTSAEWMVSGDPLTPVNIQLKRQTQVGSPSYRFVPPIGIDGATIFPSANGLEIREFLFADIEQAYQATDLSLLSGHLISYPQDQAYDKHNRQAYIIMADGRMCVLTSFRAEDLQSWTEQSTDGKFISVTVTSDGTYFIIQRGQKFFLEKLDNQFHTDCSFEQISEEATDTFSGLTALEGKTLKIVADDIVVPDAVVVNGCITLEYPAKHIKVGLPFTHRITPLPPAIGASNGPAPVSAARLVKAVFRVIDTASLEIDTGTGLHQEMTRPLASYKLGSIMGPKTTDVVIRSLGWTRSPTQPLWLIQGDTPKPFKLVSVTSDIQIGG